MGRLGRVALLALLAAALATEASAVTITIVNKDPSGQGLNDPTAAPAVGGNPGTTIGDQRLNVFKEAARIWGQILPGNVEIRVDASFSSTMDCSATSAVLGGTSPTYVEAQFHGAPEFELWYVVAEANQFAGYDLEPGSAHMSAQFNSKLGQSGCLTGHYFYYGFDTNTPSGYINLLTVTLHEFAHGLGYISVADESTGAWLGNRGDIFSSHILDATAGKTWTQMTSDGDRKASAVNTGHVVWNGAATNAAAAGFLSKKPLLDVTAPAAIAGKMEVGTAQFGAALTQTGVSGLLVAALDPSDTAGTLTTDACSALTNASAVSGRIALVDRGTCPFAQKAYNVQAAGAIGLVVANNTGGLVNMAKDTGGLWQSITIPLVSVSMTDGGSLRSSLPATVRIGLDAVQLAGSDPAGRILLYAPNPVEPGSSISHFDTSAVPNLLMEPNISSDLPIGVDITTALLADIGWFGATPSGPASYFLPSVAHTAGGTAAAPAFYTSDFFVANVGGGTAAVTVKFLGHDVDGSAGAEQSFTLGAGRAATYRDVLGSLFGLTSGNFYGALRITADSSDLKIGSVTTTPTPGGTGALGRSVLAVPVPGGTGAFGQSVPAVPTTRLITSAAPATVAGVREDGVARTNLALLNTTANPIDVDVELVADGGASLGKLSESLLPLGMTQIGRVVERITGARNVSNATLVLSTSTSGGAFTAFASLVDNETNDPATLLPDLSNQGAATSLLVPAVARSAGGTVTAPAYYTSDLFVTNRGSQTAHYTLKFTPANTPDGTLGPERSYTLPAGQAATFRDVLGTVFGLSSNADFGALRISSDIPGLAADSVTTTPNSAGAGLFGQSVPGIPSGRWIVNGLRATIVGVREDGTARTNLVLANATANTVEVDVALYGDDGIQLGATRQEFLPPLGMKQVGRIVEGITGSRNTSNATLVLWTPTAGGAFTAFASLVNNGTNDPATLLPQ